MLVVIDDFSKYPEVEFVASTSAEDTISKMKKVMATHSLSGELKTDNGRSFTSHEWATYLKSHGTKH